MCGEDLSGEKDLKVLCREYTYGGHSSGGIKIKHPEFTNLKMHVLNSKFICLELSGQPVTNSGIQMFGVKKFRHSDFKWSKIQVFRFQVVRIEVERGERE